MVIGVTILFGISLTGIIALFGIKHWELTHGRVLMPLWREKNDARALHVKELALAARKDLQDLLPRAVLLSRYLVHEAALGIAQAARYSEQQAHRLADMVSHKRGFERRETRSEFLRKVSEGREETRE